MLKGRFLRGMAAGALVGAAAGIFLSPQMDRRTRRRIQRTGRKMMDFTNDIFGDIRDFRK